MKTITSKFGSEITRTTFATCGIKSPIASMCKEKKEVKKDIYKYGMTKEEYETYMNNLY